MIWDTLPNTPENQHKQSILKILPLNVVSEVATQHCPQNDTKKSTKIMFLTNKQIHKYHFWEPVIWGLETLQLVLLQFWPLDLSRYRDRTARSVPKSLAAFCKNLKLIEGFIALFTPSERLGLFSLCQ